MTALPVLPAESQLELESNTLELTLCCDPLYTEGCMCFAIPCTLSGMRPAFIGAPAARSLRFGTAGVLWKAVGRL